MPASEIQPVPSPIAALDTAEMLLSTLNSKTWLAPVSPAAGNLLVALMRSGTDKTSVGDIAQQQTGKSGAAANAAASAMLAVLEAAGYVKFARGGKDRRVRMVTLTGQAHTTLGGDGEVHRHMLAVLRTATESGISVPEALPEVHSLSPVVYYLHSLAGMLRTTEQVGFARSPNPLTPADFALLRTLVGMKANGIPVVNVRQVQCISTVLHGSGNVTTMVDNLEAAGFIAVDRYNQADRRAVLPYPTPVAVALYAADSPLAKAVAAILQDASSGHITKLE